MNHSKSPSSTCLSQAIQPIHTGPNDQLRVFANGSGHTGALAQVAFAKPIGSLANAVHQATEFNHQPDTLACELPMLGDTNTVETWLLASEGVSHGELGQVRWSAGGGFLWLGVSLACDTDADICAVTDSAYEQLLAVMAQSDAPYMLRCWNYVPHINTGMELGDSDNEIYKRFCTGRLQAFSRAGLQGEDFPAASAVGHGQPSLTVHILACRTPGKHFGNAKQVDAFAYPRQYGVSSPSFARATAWANGAQSLLFVSGTASIVGHESRCQGDLSGQLAITLDNIQTLLEQAQKKADQVSLMRVYLRHKNDLETTAKTVASRYPNAQVIYLLADICRAELLVEIECICT